MFWKRIATPVCTPRALASRRGLARNDRLFRQSQSLPLSREAFFYPWDTAPGAQWAFLNTVSGAEMTTLVLSATDPVRNALPPTTECSPITVSPPRMDAPE